MAILDIKEIAYLKNSEMLAQKIDKIKAALHGIGCAATFPSCIYVEKNEMSFELRISFPLPYFRSVGNLKAKPGENFPPAKKSKK